MSEHDRNDGHEPTAGERAAAARAGHEGTHRFRRFWLTELAVRNTTSVVSLFAIIAVLGLISYVTIPKESSPEILIPIVAINTVYPGVAPKDMETLVTRVIEDELNTIPDIVELTSTSVEGYSSVIAEFDLDMDMDEALQKVRERVDLAKAELPDDAEDPTIHEFNFAEFPIMQVNVSGAYSLTRLKELAEDMQDRIEQIPSILEAQLAGGLEREVQVDIDLARLQYYDVSFQDVIDAIREENLNIPGGGIEIGAQEYLVRVAGEFEEPSEIGDVVIVVRQGSPVYVRDVATVDFGFQDRDSYARLDHQPVVTLGIVMRAGENIIETADAVRAVIEDMRPNFPATTVVKITSDQSQDIREMVASLENNIIAGLILVVAVLLFFLGVRNAGFVGISIPMSMLLSFIVMKTVGINMNMVVLFSLILALGMLVDNAIVVVENIYRFMEQGYDRFKAAVLATAEVAMPVIASTATTLAAFMPLLFWPDIVGEFMGFLPKTLMITLASSLFVALVIVPTLCALFMRLENAPKQSLTPWARWTLIGVAALFLLFVAASSILAAVLLALTGVALVALHGLVMRRIANWWQNEGMPVLVDWYERRLRWALDHRAVILSGAVGVFVGTILLFGTFNAGSEFFPESIPPSQVWVDIDVPEGTSADFTNRIATDIEAQLAGIEGIDDAESVVTTVVGTSRGNVVFGGGGEGSVAVSFRDYQDRVHDPFATLREMQENLGTSVAGATISAAAPNNGPPTGSPVSIELVGEDIEVLRQLSDSVLAILKTSPVYARLEGLESDMARGRAEMVVDIDRERAGLYGLSTSLVGNTIRTAIQGAEASKYRQGNDEYDIRVRLAKRYRTDLEALRDISVVSDEGQQVPLLSVASWRVEEGLGSVNRKDTDRVASVTSDVRSGENTNAVLAEVQQALAGFAENLPAGYHMMYAGEQQEQQESMEFLMGAFLMALLLIGLILVSQFNSVVKPFIIMTSVVMSTIGVLWGLMIFRMPFGIIMTGVGVISLAGIVVNNAIVLIDYIDQLREREGLSRRESIVRGGRTRFRPVILTAITTVLGLVPLAIGFNFDFLGMYTRLAPEIYWGGEQAAWWGPMAIAVIVGLSFATVLTLVLVPVMYAVVDDLSIWFRTRYTRPDQELEVPVDIDEALAHPEPVGQREPAGVAFGTLGRVRRLFARRRPLAEPTG
ncbi:MAG TPA: efflux RND transporter permease subunit [Longimicrobiales bacterium]|nr:efflux RND transporter permease subunit [Longimicrobiales bacterium]